MPVWRRWAWTLTQAGHSICVNAHARLAHMGMDTGAGGALPMSKLAICPSYTSCEQFLFANIGQTK
eukprot:4732398-Lingulodinium_polyedra.AAC.1